MKDVEFRGSSLTDLRDFPPTAMRDAGHRLDKVQNGLAPDDSKPMRTIGAGVMELRIWDEAGAYRVVYVAIVCGCRVRAALLQKDDAANVETGY